MATAIEIKPQAGPQEAFLSSSADIVIFGGGAGPGKTFGLLLEPLRHLPTVKDFWGMIFRKNATQIDNPGGLWDASTKIYSYADGMPTHSNKTWRWPVGSGMKFAHLEDEKAKFSYQGAEIPYIGFDELTHFSRSQFFYMLSRNRSMCGVRPYIRATCNPDPTSWVAEFISWWIDQDTGIAIKERSGVIRWFIVINDVVLWADTRESLIAQYGADELPKSCTFIAANIYDNKILLESDPGYLANLKALGEVERKQLLEGNWKVRPIVPGCYYGDLMAESEREGRIGNVPYERGAQVYTSWDLGWDDLNIELFFQVIGKEIHVIDYAESHNKGLDYDAKVVRERPYIYESHYLPHDVEVHEKSNGKTRKDTLESLGIKPITVVPRVPNHAEGRTAVRALIPKCWFDLKKCAPLIDALRAYRPKYNETLGVFSDEPLHDWSSNAAKAFEQFARGYEEKIKYIAPPMRHIAASNTSWMG